MRILLDENFPLPLLRKLRDHGYDAEHIVVLGQRGLPDEAIRARLSTEALLFLTNDVEFLERSLPPSLVIVSRVRQDTPIAHRVEIWLAALERFIATRPEGDVFELLDSGEIVPWLVMSE